MPANDRSAFGPNGRAANSPDAAATEADLRLRCSALEQEIRDLRVLIEGVPHLIWRSCDKGYWTWAGPQWLDYTGLSYQASLGRGWLAAVHPEDRAPTMAA